MEEENKEQQPMQRTTRRKTEANGDELCPGVSSQKRVKIKAAQLFNEEQAKHTAHKGAAANRKIHT
eukprot:15242620-Heterocapsa_arctica.AAC.1